MIKLPNGDYVKPEQVSAIVLNYEENGDEITDVWVHGCPASIQFDGDHRLEIANIVSECL